MPKKIPASILYTPLHTVRGWGWVFILLLLQSCRHDIIVWPSEEEEVGETRQDSILGFYLLNEGNMGSNKCTMDFYDYATGTYTRNVYGNANPSAVKELGDVGNDLRIYGSRMWAVINCSNKIEVMEACTARRVGQVNLANCRYIAFHEGYAYVSSYAGPVQINPDYEQKGIVVKIDTATLEKVDTCIVGFQPDRLDITGGKIYVANSGGYMFPNYENTVSVIDICTRNKIKLVFCIIKSENNKVKGCIFTAYFRNYCICCAYDISVINRKNIFCFCRCYRAKF